MTFEFHETYRDPKTKRLSKHVYLLDGRRMAGVTTVLGVIAKPALISWASKMAVEAIEEAGEVSYTTLTVKDWQRVKIEAESAHTRKKESAGQKGTDTHALVEQYIKMCIEKGGNSVALGQSNAMVAEFINWAITNKVQFLESEKKLYSKEWFVAGTTDFTCIINGKRFVGDLKTMKTMWDRVPFFQTAAYMKMLKEMGEENYDGSVIVNINKETNELTEYYSYDWESDLKAFEAALTLYRSLNQGI